LYVSDGVEPGESAIFDEAEFFTEGNAEFTALVGAFPSVGNRSFIEGRLLLLCGAWIKVAVVSIVYLNII